VQSLDGPSQGLASSRHQQAGPSVFDQVRDPPTGVRRRRRRTGPHTAWAGLQSGSADHDGRTSHQGRDIRPVAQQEDAVLQTSLGDVLTRLRCSGIRAILMSPEPHHEVQAPVLQEPRRSTACVVLGTKQLGGSRIRHGASARGGLSTSGARLLRSTSSGSMRVWTTWTFSGSTPHSRRAAAVASDTARTPCAFRISLRPGPTPGDADTSRARTRPGTVERPGQPEQGERLGAVGQNEMRLDPAKGPTQPPRSPICSGTWASSAPIRLRAGLVAE